MENNQELIIRNWQLQLTADDVLQGQGANPHIIRQRRPDLVEIAEWALREGLPLLEPVILARQLKVEAVRHERLVLEGGAFLSGSLIAQHLAGAQRVIVILCTIGKTLETIAAEVLRTDLLHGLALDGLGSVAVEQLAVRACSYFGDQAAAEGLNASIPLSPGMVGWSVDPAQRQIFDIINPQQVGVSLTPSWMMDPVKSLTQVLGIGETVTYQGRTCDFCSLKETCRYQDHYSAVEG